MHTITLIDSVYKSEIKLYEIRPYYNLVCVTDFAVCVKDWLEKDRLCNVLWRRVYTIVHRLSKNGFPLVKYDFIKTYNISIKY